MFWKKETELNYEWGNPQVEKFADFALWELAKKDIRVRIVLNNKVEDCGGWFDCEGKEMVMAVSRDPSIWYGVFTHEFSHFVQWRDQTPAWKACYDSEGNDLTENIWSVIDGSYTMSDDDYKKVCSLVRDMECEAERISLKFVKDFKIPIDTVEYSKLASVYIRFYDYIAKHRAWCDKKSVYEDVPDEIRALMPDNIYGFDFRNLKMPEVLENFYATRCSKPRRDHGTRCTKRSGEMHS